MWRDHGSNHSIVRQCTVIDSVEQWRSRKTAKIAWKSHRLPDAMYVSEQEAILDGDRQRRGPANAG
jgi:hypothetical protein